MDRQDLVLPSGADSCAAWLYPAESNAAAAYRRRRLPTSSWRSPSARSLPSRRLFGYYGPRFDSGPHRQSAADSSLDCVHPLQVDLEQVRFRPSPLGPLTACRRRSVSGDAEVSIESRARGVSLESAQWRARAHAEPLTQSSSSSSTASAREESVEAVVSLRPDEGAELVSVERTDELARDVVERVQRKTGAALSGSTSFAT